MRVPLILLLKQQLARKQQPQRQLQQQQQLATESDPVSTLQAPELLQPRLSQSPTLKEPALLQLVEGDGGDGIQSATGYSSLSGSGFQPALGQWTVSGNGGVRGSLPQRAWEGVSYDVNDLHYAAKHPRNGVAVGVAVLAHVLVGVCLLFRWCTFANWCCSAFQQPITKSRHGRDADGKQQRRRMLMEESIRSKESTIKEPTVAEEEPICSKEAAIQDLAIAEDTDPLAAGGDMESGKLPSVLISSTEVQVIEAGHVEPVIGNNAQCRKVQLDSTGSMELEDCFVEANEAWVRHAEARQADEIIEMQQEEPAYPCNAHSNVPDEQECQLEELSTRSNVESDKSEWQENQEELFIPSDVQSDESERQGEQEELADALEACYEIPEPSDLQLEDETVSVVKLQYDESEQHELQLEEPLPALETLHELPEQPELQREETQEAGEHTVCEKSSFTEITPSDERAHQQLKVDPVKEQQQQQQQQQQQESVGRVRELKRRIEARSQQQHASPAAIRASSPKEAFRFDGGAAAAAAAMARVQRLKEAAGSFHDSPGEQVASFFDSLA